ncbi:glycosyltransferase family 9 protein [Oleiharenicola lentus]|uniref:glycosyltransferase family 9 protein n=1 Tax=Oleiharenicola lentus TaxID=2508720 RepID=UPI003F67D316
MKSLLVIKPSSLGDIVHALQVVQTLAKERPECRISWVVRERFAGLVQAAPFVHEVIIFRRRDGTKAFLNLLRALRGRQFDAVWDMQGLLRSGLMTWAVRSPQKWGRKDAREGAGIFYDRRVALPAAEGPHHALDILQQFLPAAGVAPRIDFPLVLKPDAAQPWAEFFSADPANTFVMFTDSRGAEKEWPRFNELTTLIFETIPNARVAWCAGKLEEPKVAVPAERFLNLTGCPMDQMIALVRQPATFIGNDSGPMHLSAASGNRVLAIFGPTSPQRFGPYPLSNRKHCAVEAPGGNLAVLAPVAVLGALQELQARKL